MNDTGARATARLATAVGCVAIGSAASLAAEFAVGGPFGTLNDLGNAAAAVLSGALAWRMRHELSDRTRIPAVGAAGVGAAVAALGAGLVVSDTTGWFLGGSITSLGFAGIGAWLLAVCRSATEVESSPKRLRDLGTVAGAVMLVGLAGVPAIMQRLDDAATAPGWAWVGSVAWLGIFVLYPAWALRYGALRVRAGRPVGLTPRPVSGA
jgi:hypothetical protein